MAESFSSGQDDEEQAKDFGENAQAVGGSFLERKFLVQEVFEADFLKESGDQAQTAIGGNFFPGKGNFDLINFQFFGKV